LSSDAINPNVEKPRFALITGASAGLGAEFARQLAAMGKSLILVARRRDRLEALAERLRKEHGIQVEIVTADLSLATAAEEIATVCASEHLQVDWLINNAGIAGPDLLKDRDWQMQQPFFQLMMLSVADLCHRLIPDMVDRGYGRVINVASVAARVPRSGGCNYGPAKAYLVALSEELHLTVSGSGVNVSALCPGFTHTDFHETAGLMEMKNKMAKWLWYDADVVVEDAINGVQSGKPVVVSGRLYRWLDPIFQSVWTRRFLRIRARPE
jgi:short-subunit dehydrogenase